MSFGDALLGLADDLNAHFGTHHDVAKLRQQHAHKLAQNQQLRQHKQAQQQQQRKRFREEQRQQQQLQYNHTTAAQHSAIPAGRVQRRGAWSSDETSQLQSLIRAAQRGKQGYSTDSDDDDSDTEDHPAAADSSAELQFDDFCAIARRLRRPVQEVMTFSASANSPLAAFLQSSSEAAAPESVAEYTAFIAQQFDLSLAPEAHRQWSRQTMQQDSREQERSGRHKQESKEEKPENGKPGEEEDDEEENEGESEEDGAESEVEAETDKRRRVVQPARTTATRDDDSSDDSDESYRDDNEHYEEEDGEEAADEHGEDEKGSEEDHESGSESDTPLSARARQKTR